MKKNLLKGIALSVCLMASVCAGAQINLGNLGKGLGEVLGSNLSSIISGKNNVTVESLTGTWSYQQPAVIFESSNLMKQAGYKTFWITNQQTMTERNTMLTTFSKQADEQVYLNNNREQNARQYDGEVLTPFSKALADQAPRKLIVVHLLGTHMSYKYRYPQEYDQFNDRQGVPAWVTNDQLPTYNSYDNAVLYNDFVVSSLIERLSGSQANGFLLYLSDHGEAVFDSPTDTILGRSEGRPTAPMYTIPFMLWTSKQWQANNPTAYQTELSRPYSSANLIHTWANLAGLRSDELDPSKSLVSATFKERPLLIGDPYEPKSMIDFSLIKPKPQVALADKNQEQLNATPMN